MKPYEKFPLPSEVIEPFAALLIGRMWTRCEYAKTLGPRALETECVKFWWVAEALSAIAIALEGSTHFSMASTNEMRRVSDYIQDAMGVNPDKDPRFKR